MSLEEIANYATLGQPQKIAGKIPTFEQLESNFGANTPGANGSALYLIKGQLGGGFGQTFNVGQAGAGNSSLVAVLIGLGVLWAILR